MRWSVALVYAMACGCGGEDVAQQKQPLSEDFPLSLSEAEAAIAAHDGVGCLRMTPFVECRGCDPRYRLDRIVENAVVGPCEKSTFVAGTDVQLPKVPLRNPTWTCQSGPLGGIWLTEGAVMRGALVCR